MIIKCISKHGGTKQLLNYLFKDEKKLTDKKYTSRMMLKHNVTGKTIERFAAQFKFNESLRMNKRKDAVSMYHTIISFSNLDRDHLNKKVLTDIAKKYIDLQGKDNMYVITHHIEKEHIHLHVAMSGTKFLTGQANRLTKKQFQELKLEMEKYQKEKYPKLVNSLVHQTKSRNKNSSKNINPNGRQTQKEALLKGIEQAYALSNSLSDFLQEIRMQGHEPYFRNEKLAGLKFEGDRKFRFSRLGFDKQKFDELEARENQESKELDELQNLRDGSKSSSRENDTRARFLDDEKENEEQEELETEDELEQTDDYER